MRSCDGHGAASQGNDQDNWPNPNASLFTDLRSLPGRMTEVQTASPVLAFVIAFSRVATDMLDTQFSEDLAPLPQRRLVLRGDSARRELARGR